MSDIWSDIRGQSFVVAAQCVLPLNAKPRPCLFPQRGNPLLKHIVNVPWEFGQIVPDYVMGPTTCAMFLSLRYHNLNPNYIHDRLKVLGKQYVLRVLLVQVFPLSDI